MVEHKGKLVIIDGIDGSGKGTLVQALALHEWRKNQNLRFLDLKMYGEQYHSLPQPGELKNYDIIISSEPTFSLIGRAIREEIVRHNRREYSALATAQAFALDRYVLYKRVIIPALEQGKYIFQERGVTTSICYQPIQMERLPLEEILELEGNQLTLKYRPDLLILTKIKLETALKRLRSRVGKQDAAIFERTAFLEKAQKRFVSPWFKELFEKYGTKVVYIDTNKSKEESIKEVIQIWEDYSSK